MYVKTIFIILISFLLILFTLSVQSVLAHEEASDASMEVLIHVEPNDEPIPGEPVVLHFEFTDELNKFKFANCDCKLTISEQGKQLYLTTLLPTAKDKPNIYAGFANFTFPNRDTYQINLTGNPKNLNSFKPFEVFWNFSVDKYPKPVTFDFARLLAYPRSILGILVILLVVSIVIKFTMNKSKNNPRKKN